MVETKPNLNMNLEGKSIVVIGAAQGIGQATARWLSHMGVKLTIADIQNCDETLSQCSKDTKFETVDMSDKQQIEALLERATALDTPLYGVVNCSGVLMRRPLEQTQKDEIELQTAVNQSGVFFLARKALEIMEKQGEGRIILYTSQGAFTGGFNGSIPYAMNKSAVTALVKSLARIAAPSGITVNAVAPGAADTKMLRGGMSEDDLENFRKMIPIGRFADPDELAAPTAFLLSAWAQYITGTTLHVNGGQLMV